MEQKFFLYARKSTDVEDKQILSIEAQITELRAYAKQENLPPLRREPQSFKTGDEAVPGVPRSGTEAKNEAKLHWKAGLPW